MSADQYLLALALVFAINLLPAFGPPTWSVLVLLTLNLDLEPGLVVPLGALAAASGRYLLATAARGFRGRFSAERLANLAAAEQAVTASRSRAFAGLALFAVSPLPSAQLFVGAGLLNVPLLPLTAAFFAGRLVSYSLYVGAATAVGESIGEIVGDSLTSPAGIAVQLVMLAGLAGLVRVDWARLLRRD
ncbi:MAG: hypothetical protein ABI726_02050 [bacterium]